MNTNQNPETINVACYECGDVHIGTIAHVDSYNSRQLYAVVCDKDGLTAYYNTDAAV